MDMFMFDVDARHIVEKGCVIERNNESFFACDAIVLNIDDKLTVTQDQQTRTVVIYDDPKDDFWGFRAKPVDLV